MYHVKTMHCILSVLYTVKQYENVQPDIYYIKRLLYKAIHQKPFSRKEKRRIRILSVKCRGLLIELDGRLEEKNDKIGRIALMNDLCYNYYLAESFILRLQNKQLDTCIARIDSINKDIEDFNKNYENEHYIEKDEQKYTQFTAELFQDFKFCAQVL